MFRRYGSSGVLTYAHSHQRGRSTTPPAVIRGNRPVPFTPAAWARLGHSQNISWGFLLWAQVSNDVRFALERKRLSGHGAFFPAFAAILQSRGGGRPAIW